MLSATVWNFNGRWSNFDFEYHFKTIEMMYKTGQYPLSYNSEYNVGFYPPLSHIIVKWFILAIGHPSLTVEGSLQRPWTEMFVLNSFVNAPQVIPLFLVARRFAQSNLAGVSACILIVANGFQTWSVMGIFPDMYGMVFISFAICFLFLGYTGTRWAALNFILAGVFLVCAGFTHPLSYVFSVVFPLGMFIGRLGYRAISRHGHIVKLRDRALLILCLVSLIVPGVSYYSRADYSLYQSGWFEVPSPFYINPVTRILFDPWPLISLVVVGYSLWGRRSGGFLIGTWFLLPFILVALYGFFPPYTLILDRYLTYGQPYFSQPQAILLGSGIAFLLHEATAETDFGTRRINQLRLPLLGLVIIGALFQAGGLLASPSTTSVTTSIHRILQGICDLPTISDMVSNLLYLGLGVSVCLIVEFSALRFLVSKLRQRARPRWNDQILG